ncbi:MAG: hypothetical protein AAGA61_07665 [Pseudomonadota bacterium]
MLIVRTLFIAALCCAPFATSDAEPSDETRFVLLVDEDAPGIEQLLEQRPEAAMDVAADAARLRNPEASQTLLCITLIAQRRLDDAEAPCDAAVTLAEVPLTSLRNPYGHRNRESLAIAYSNRAVLNALRGDVDAADDDIVRALRQKRHRDALLRNQAVVAATRLANAD